MRVNRFYIINNNVLVKTNINIIKTYIISKLTIITNKLIRKDGICFNH